MEDCDDGNQSSGDACPANCRQADAIGLVRGADLGSSLAVDGANYLPARNISRLRVLGVADHVLAFAQRGDGIGANLPSNDRIELSELDVLTTEPFLSSLFPQEREAAEFLWEIMQVSAADVHDINSPASPPEIFVENASVRPGQVEIPLIAIDSIVRNANVRDAPLTQAAAPAAAESPRRQCRSKCRDGFVQ